MNDENQSKKNETLKVLIEHGAEIAGSAVGGAIGFFAAGPAGAALLGAAGSGAAIALRKAGDEINKRLLSPREEVRVGSVLAIAADTIKKRTDAGEKIRSDDFFEPKSNNRSNADEVAENVLLKSQREAEEKKIPYIAKFLSTVAFDPNISTAYAHQLIKAVEKLTYRQLCLLRLFAIKQHFNLRDTSYKEQNTGVPRALYSVLFECHELYNAGYIDNGGAVVLSLPDYVPSQIKLQGTGVDIHNFFALPEIPMTDLQEVARPLQLRSW
jgi:hypothetical protein